MVCTVRAIVEMCKKFPGKLSHAGPTDQRPRVEIGPGGDEHGEKGDYHGGHPEEGEQLPPTPGPTSTPEAAKSVFEAFEGVGREGPRGRKEGKEEGGARRRQGASSRGSCARGAG